MPRLNSRFLYISIFVVMLISGCGVPNIPSLQPAPTATVTPVPLPPAISETVPPVGSELGPKATMLILFSGPMDKASVEGALTSDFAGGHLLNWVDETTLAVTPKSNYPVEGQVTFTLAASAKSTDGLAMPNPQTFSYRTAGPLRVSQVLPAPQSTDISPDSAVVVSFNQPVVALGTDSSAVPAGLTIEPSAPGKGEWLNTSTYIFHPEPALAGGADYNVRVNSQLSGTNGAALDTAVQWSFRTSLPRLVTVRPTEGDGPLLLDPELQLTFNQPMDRTSVEAGLAFSGPGGKLNGSFVWNEKSTVVTFKPSTLLERSATYTLTLSGQAKSRAGATLGNDSKFTYQSVAPFGILSTPFTSGTARPREKSITLTFTAPFEKYKNSDLNELITVTPQPNYGGFYIDGQTITINGMFDPGRSYLVTFSRNLKDRWGQALGEDLTFSFREPDALPSVNFSTVYSPTLFTTPNDPRLSVQAVNVRQLHIVLGDMSLSNFFRYQSDYDYQRGYTPTELDAWDELLDLAPNQNKPYTVDLSRDNARPPLTPNLYYVRISSRDTDAPPAVAPLLISNINVTLKTNKGQALLWAVDLRTKTPVANAPVSLYGPKGQIVTNGTTDSNGIWQGTFTLDKPSYENTYAVVGQPGDETFGMAADGWNAEIAPWNFGLRDGSDVPNEKFYLYTERPIYRPGDVVHYRGIIRNAFDGRYSDSKIADVTIGLTGPSNEITQKVSVSAYGTFQGEFQLSANTSPGYYSLVTKNSDPNDSTFNFDRSVSFQVADYRKPEINLSATIAPNPALNGQALTGTINAAYFFGAPVSDLPFEWRLYRNPSHFDLPGYTTGLYSTDWYNNPFRPFGQQIASGSARTGTDGTFSLALDQITADDTSELTLEITATESGGFPVSARASTTLHPTSFYLGVRPEKWFGRINNDIGFDVLAVDLDGKKLANKPVTASFLKVTWEREDLLYDFNFTPTYTPVFARQLTTDGEGKAHSWFTPSEAGTYMLEISSDGAKSQVLLWVGGAQDAAWPNLPFQRMELTADRENYKPGDSANVFVPSDFDVPALALITTERSSVLSSQVVTVPPEGYTFTLPLTDAQAPNTYVSVTMLGPDTDFRQGYINLPVEPSAFKLNVELKATPEKAKPGDKLTLDLTVTDSQGKPVQAEFSMAVVDLAVLALAGPNSEEIMPTFYGIQPLGIRTGLTAAIYARRALSQPAGGGGGGGGDPMSLRENFPDTLYWKADIVTDAQGKAQVSITLPDSLTTWQVDTRGLTKDTRVGQAVVRVVTSKELLIRPQTPRFLVVGDKTELAAIVNNNTAADVDATVTLQATGFTLTDPATVGQKVTVPANGRIRVAWAGTVKAEDVVNPIFSVKAGNLEDAARPNDGDIPVLHYSAPQTFSTAGVLADAASRLEILALPKSFTPLGGKLNLELSPSLASVIVSELQGEKITPEDINWNNERLASHVLSQLAMYQTLKDAGLSNDPLSTDVLDAVHRLITNQNQTDGGWAWTTAINESSDPYLTAYILFAMQQVSKAGLVDVKNAIERGYTYLTTAPPLDRPNDLNQPWALNRAVFHTYVMQQTNGVRLDNLDTLYNKRDQLDPWAKALLASMLLANAPGDQRAQSLSSELQSSAIRSATGVHWESKAADRQNPNSPLFTTAVVVYTLAQRDSANPILPDAVRYLVSQRGAATRWGSSYETTWVTLALTQYMKGTGELKGSFNFSAALNGSPFANGAQALETVTASAPLEQLYTASPNSLLISREAGTGKLYYRAALTLDQPVEKAPAISQGINVSRQFLTCNGASCQPISTFKLPDDLSGRVKVQVTVTLSNDAYYLMVQDNIPAGADILDSSLKTSQQGEPSQAQEQVTPTPSPRYDNANPFGDGWGWWYFNSPQIYSDHILWSASYLPAGTYVLSYTIVPTLPGAYHVLPAHAWQAYFPEVQGTSAGNVFEIK